MMLGEHDSLQSVCGTDDAQFPDASSPRSGPVSETQPVFAQVEISTEDPNQLDVGTLSKVLFERARMYPSLQLIPTVQRELIVNALHETAGNYVQAAKLLGITRSTLRKRLDKFGIKQHFSVH